MHGFLTGSISLPWWLHYFAVLWVGLCLGSFLNVVLYRIGWGPTLRTEDGRPMTLSHPPSHCPVCKHTLAWWDNIPVLSWIFLRGKCRYCHTNISVRYPFFELVVGVGITALYVACVHALNWWWWPGLVLWLFFMWIPLLWWMYLDRTQPAFIWHKGLDHWFFTIYGILAAYLGVWLWFR